MKFGELKSWQKKRLLMSFFTYVIIAAVFWDMRLLPCTQTKKQKMITEYL